MGDIAHNVGEIVSHFLWRHQALEVNNDKPFRLSSGNYTPIYINCRLLISYPATRDVLMALAHQLVAEEQIEADCIAGGETAGMPFGAWLADRLNKPFVYVRKKRKGHGSGLRVEGVAQGKVLLVEDLITDGGSKLGFIEGIREAECSISDCLVLVDREQSGSELLAQAGVRLHTLVGIQTVLDIGRELGLLADSDRKGVEQYLADEKDWHQKQGLTFSHEA